MKLVGFLVAFATAACGVSTSAQGDATAPLSSAPSAGSEYINAPDWASKPDMGGLSPYRPVDANVPGGAVVDCVARSDGRLVDCKTLEVRPTGLHYESAGPLAVERLYRLKPTLADGRSVAGMHVVVTVIWR